MLSREDLEGLGEGIGLARKARGKLTVRIGLNLKERDNVIRRLKIRLLAETLNAIDQFARKAFTLKTVVRRKIKQNKQVARLIELIL